MRISVIVPFHNARAYIRACVEGLLAMTSPKAAAEIIMVDNNSTDGSADIVREYPRVRLLSESKRGAYAARNRAAVESSGDIIAFTDSDCVPAADWLDRIAAAMTAPGILLIQGRQRFAGETPALAGLSDYESEKAAYVFSSGVPEIYYGYTNNMAVRRHVFDRVGPFLELERGADVIFVQRVLAEYSAAAIAYRSNVFVRHLEITSAMSWFRKMQIYGRSSRRYGPIANARPLTSRERLQIFRATVHNCRYSALRSTLLMGVLAVGAAAYELGRLRGQPDPLQG